MIEKQRYVVALSQSELSENSSVNAENLPSYFIKLSKFKDNYPLIKQDFRPVMNQESTDDSIVIFGCSYAYGYVFPNEQTISYVLSKYSNRPIYNRAFYGWGIQHMLYQLKSDLDLSKEVKKPKFVFYVLMDHAGHFKRLYYTNFSDVLSDEYYLSYKQKNQQLVERTPLFNFYYDLSLTRHIYNKFISYWASRNMKKEVNHKILDFFVLHMTESNKLIKQKWGNDTKFIILSFHDNFLKQWQPILNEHSIDVIDIAETIGIEDLEAPEHGFFEPEIHGHPNAKIWELLAPKLKEMYPDL